MKRTLFSVKEVAQELGGECAIDSTCVLERRDSRLSHQHNVAVRSGSGPEGFSAFIKKRRESTSAIMWTLWLIRP